MVIIPEGEQPFIQSIDSAWYGNRVAEVAMLRLDVVHPVVSGNKWYKLKHNIQYCLDNHITTILTFGGAYSNHLVATAAAAQLYGVQSVGIIKGKYAETNLTPTLKSCLEYGMELQFVTNEEYDKKNDEGWLQQLSEKYKNALIVPEGGANDMGRAGASDIAELIPERFTHIAISVGTGTSLTGVLNNLRQDATVIGFAPMKGGAYLNEEVREYIQPDKRQRYIIYDDWHFGGFGKHTDELISFMNEFYEHHRMPLDMVYTAKMMFGLREQVMEGLYPETSKILCVHTGGLQGNLSIKDRLVY